MEGIGNSGQAALQGMLRLEGEKSPNAVLVISNFVPPFHAELEFEKISGIVVHHDSGDNYT